MIKSKELRHWLVVAIVTAAAGIVPSVASAESKGLIKFHEAENTGNLIDAKLAELILVDEMGYEVQYVFLPLGPPTWEAVRAGDIDVAFEFWPSSSPERGEYLEEFGGDGSAAFLGEMGIRGASGYYVPRYVIEGDPDRGISAVATDLVSWEQLNKYKDLFATPETTPHGRLIGCPYLGWQCQDEERAKSLKLDYVVATLGSEVAQFAELEAAYSRREPILVYLWEPHWTHAKYDLVELKLPDYTDECWSTDFACDWPEDITYNFGSATLQERYPDVFQLVWNISLSNQDQADMSLKVDVNDQEIEEVVREWMANNEDVWKSWIP